MEHQVLTSSTSAARLILLADFWQQLTSGAIGILSSWYSPRECFVKVRPTVLPASQPILSTRDRSIVERVLAGESQKRVAIELNLAVSTVCALSRRSLSAMGASGTASRAPMLLLLAAHAAIGARVAPAVLVRTADCEGDEFVLVAQRPDAQLDSLLPGEESDVARGLLEGQTYAEIARRRRRSCRTIANQLSSTFRKLKVSGRTGLLSELLRQKPRSLGAEVSEGPSRVTLAAS